MAETIESRAETLGASHRFRLLVGYNLDGKNDYLLAQTLFGIVLLVRLLGYDTIVIFVSQVSGQCISPGAEGTRVFVGPCIKSGLFYQNVLNINAVWNRCS